MDLQKLGEEVYGNAVRKGFYDMYSEVMDALKLVGHKKFLHQLWLSHRLMLIVTELAEAQEALRDDNYSIEPKSGGFGEELADTQIRLADLAQHTIGVANFVTAIDAKQIYNSGRPMLHGRKL